MFSPIEEVIEDIKNGKIVIVVDDENRENEGDFVLAAECVTPQKINFMIKEGRGLVCVPLTEERIKELNLELPYLQSSHKRDSFLTGWCMPVDAASGITTGISAFDRARTVEVLISPHTRPEDLVRPGHIFPLKARKGGVLVRAGHTEAAVDLARLAGLYPAGVICEIIKDDGSMARLPDLIEIAKEFGLKICTIASLIEYRRRKEKLVELVEKIKLPTEYGEFDLYLYKSQIDDTEHLALVRGKIESDKPVLVRVHSQCLTGDVLHSLRCDCGRQLEYALRRIGKEGGVILYMRQEGRGIGLVNKLKSYVLQDKGLDTVEANEALGFPPDLRNYGIGAQILVDLGVKEIRLLTNNPRKIIGLEGYNLKIVERIYVDIGCTEFNKKYLEAKRDKLDHLI